MTYVDGFMAAVPTANKEAYRAHAEIAASLFKEHGALTIMECWGDDLPEGKRNSMHTAVLREPEESVVMSFITWPSKAVRDEAWRLLMEDPRMAPDANPMPFDGSRLIYGGYEVLLTA